MRVSIPQLMKKSCWRRDEYPDKKGNIRDYASISELICLSNIENINAILIEADLKSYRSPQRLNMRPGQCNPTHPHQ